MAFTSRDIESCELNEAKWRIYASARKAIIGSDND